MIDLHSFSFLVLVILLALVFDLSNGFNDAANAIATVISTRVMSPLAAVLMAAVMNLVGALSGTAVAKVVEQGDHPGSGDMVTMLEQVPSGKTALYVPCPGGQMKFHVLYDEVDELYWLLSTQATDSMRRAELLPANRYSLPNNERRRLQLHFSRNMIDWCFAGMVAIGPVEQGSRHYASMIVDGEDLCILSRSGDERAMDPHNGNLITFHRVRGFRGLVY